MPLFTQQQNRKHSHRPTDFESFVGQEHIKKVLKTAIISAQKSEHSLGHILFAGPSGYGKTTLAELVTHQLGSNFFQITAYAITKPAEIISLLQKLGPNDILFIDEIHRIKSNLEEILYIAMEDHRIDMILPDGTNLSLPVQPFTLIGATTQAEKLSAPLKNRFIYNFSFSHYNQEEKQKILAHYLAYYNIAHQENNLVSHMATKIDTVPREIKNLCTKLRDYLISDTANQESQKGLLVDHASRGLFVDWLELEDHGITHLHKQYLSILQEAKNPIGLKTIAIKLGINEKAVEDDIEPLLFKIGKIEKTPQGRILNS